MNLVRIIKISYLYSLYLFSNAGPIYILDNIYPIMIILLVYGKIFFVLDFMFFSNASYEDQHEAHIEGFQLLILIRYVLSYFALHHSWAFSKYT